MGRSSYAKRGDSDELAHRAYKDVRNEYGSIIEIAKRPHWGDFLQSVDYKTVWTEHQYASGDPTDGSKTRVPMHLGRQEDRSANEAVSNEEKGNTFTDIFFSAPELEEQLNNDDEYPTPKFLFSPISKLQIK